MKPNDILKVLADEEALLEAVEPGRTTVFLETVQAARSEIIRLRQIIELMETEYPMTRRLSFASATMHIRKVMQQ